MRHRHKKTKFRLGTQKKDLVVRSLLTNLVRYGAIKTTSRKAFVLKAEADSFFATLVKYSKTKAANDAKREIVRLVKRRIFTEEEGKKVVNELLPMMLESGKTSGFISNYKLGARKGDAAEHVLVKINLESVPQTTKKSKKVAVAA